MYENIKYSHNNDKGEINMTKEDYFRYLTKHFIKRMTRKKRVKIEKSANYAEKNRLQEWFGLFPLSLKLWYKNK